MIRIEIMRRFGYYVTESSEHNAEYMPYWIKKNYPELIEEYNIPLDEYPRRCINQINDWKKQYAPIAASKFIRKLCTLRCRVCTRCATFLSMSFTVSIMLLCAALSCHKEASVAASC